MNTPPPAGTSVVVVGAGIAGLTTALKLSQRGYDVTVYEATDVLGGNLSAARQSMRAPDGSELTGSEPTGFVYHDVYPHMFCDWYKNFPPQSHDLVIAISWKSRPEPEKTEEKE